jgi:IclR family transcriptional regulator, KDG regulon repressor
MTSMRPEGETQLLASVRNAARVLREFGNGEPQLGVSELARRVGVARSTAHRIVHTLTAEGLLERVEDTGTYRLSVVMQVLGASAQSHSLLHGAATPVLDGLRNLTKETVQVAILDRAEVVYVERRESPHTVRIFGRIGNRAPANTTGTGKLLLAYLPEAEMEARLQGVRLVRRTPYTLTNMADLRAEFSRIRLRGWSENINESEVGIASVSAPIRDRSGEVIAALSIAGPVQRLDGENLRRFVQPVCEAAAKISRRLGAQLRDEESGS